MNYLHCLEKVVALIQAVNSRGQCRAPDEMAGLHINLCSFNIFATQPSQEKHSHSEPNMDLSPAELQLWPPENKFHIGMSGGKNAPQLSVIRSSIIFFSLLTQSLHLSI